MYIGLLSLGLVHAPSTAVGFVMSSVDVLCKDRDGTVQMVIMVVKGLTLDNHKLLLLLGPQESRTIHSSRLMKVVRLL